MPKLVLASTSTYRQELLSRLRLPFTTFGPNVDETAKIGEAPSHTAERLALCKAMAAMPTYADALIIGSDQVAYDGNQVFGKPGTIPNAIEQLRTMSGREVIFHTGISVVNSRTGKHQTRGVATRVGFRELGTEEIERYLTLEDALNCAGSAKSEGLGISLLRYIRGDDPTALIGLPLIALHEMLRTEGVAVP